jgi:phosphoribosylformylglycinamidine synthase
MLWEVEITPLTADREESRIRHEYRLLTQQEPPHAFIDRTTRGFLLEGDLSLKQVESLVSGVLLDPLVECAQIRLAEVLTNPLPVATVLPRPGVMDPAALSVGKLARDLEIPVNEARTFRRYYGPILAEATQDILFNRIIANGAIEQVLPGGKRLEGLSLDGVSSWSQEFVKLEGLQDDALLAVSKRMGLALSVAEMRVIQEHARRLGRDIADIELETIAQTWSEHCSHKTLKGRVETPERTFKNLLKETIFQATVQVRKALGKDDWCVSVFEDNAGVIRFSDTDHLVFKVETHNRPSAIEPYGGASTGIGGVVRDPMGTGLGARPVCNTDVFCFGPMDYPAANLPTGVLHPQKILHGVVSGVRDYGNRMGIPTVNGAVVFHEDYLTNPLVFCGTVGLLPVNKTVKTVEPGDLIVSLGGRTGRDGIHGATFSSEGLHAASTVTSGGAVQIGNAIEEKKVLEAVMRCRDKGFYRAITDCGAGGFSSAVGEMGAELGARVDLEKAPLKYLGLSPVEIWISESQERMVLAVPPENFEALRMECEAEGVEATTLGVFQATGKLGLFWHGKQVGELDMEFLHGGRPPITRQARWSPPALATPVYPDNEDFCKTLTGILALPDVASKEWIIRQYDHEVQGGSVIKPLVGIDEAGPSDAAVQAPILGNHLGFAVACGLAHRMGRIDPYSMAACGIDEAVRNLVAVGTDPARIALLDNFCWGDTDRPEELGLLVRAAEACHDLAIAWNMPFISGKDSLKNEYKGADRRIVIPPTLLISAIGIVHDVRKALSMDLKGTGNLLYLVGETQTALAGSQYHALHKVEGGDAPQVDTTKALNIYKTLHGAMDAGLVRSAHDINEGGVAACVAEMALAGGLGCDLDGLFSKHSSLPVRATLFSESPSRFVLEVTPQNAAAFEKAMAGVATQSIGKVVKEPRLRIAGPSGDWIVWIPLGDLTAAWRNTLPRQLGERGIVE